VDGGRYGHGKVALIDLMVDHLELRLDTRQLLDDRLRLVRRALMQLEVGDQAPESQHGRRRARQRVGRLQCLAQLLQRGQHRPGVLGLVQQEAPDAGERRRPPLVPAERLEAADRLQQRERLRLMSLRRLVTVEPRTDHARRARHPQHAQHHVRLLDAPTRVQEGARLIPQHGLVEQAPEQRTALLDLLVDGVGPGCQRRLQVVAPQR
jgi:hypothetical protein